LTCTPFRAASDVATVVLAKQSVPESIILHPQSFLLIYPERNAQIVTRALKQAAEK